MRNDTRHFSFIVCAYNESDAIAGYLEEICAGLWERFGDRFELLVMENGSTDATSAILDRMQCREIRVFHYPEKSHGWGIRTGIEKSAHDHVALIGLDLPFGFTDLDRALPLWDGFDLIFGSKAHPDSVLHVTAKRKLASFVYRRLCRLMLGLPVRDTQGSLFMRRVRILPLLTQCDSPNAFFSTQLAFHARRQGLKMTEIPVTMRRTDLKRKSKYHIFRDGWRMFCSLVRERGRKK